MLVVPCEVGRGIRDYTNRYLNNIMRFMIIRHSHIVLVSKLFAIQILLVFLYLVVRLPKIALFSRLDNSQNIVLNYISLGYFMVLSLIELILVLKVTLDWANNIYEIRDDSIIHRQGIFTLKEDVYTLRNLGSATLHQSFMGKLLNYGTITISSPILKHEFHLLNVHNPGKIVQSFKDNIGEKTKKADIIRNRS